MLLRFPDTVDRKFIIRAWMCTACPGDVSPPAKHVRRTTMENILLTLLILALSAAAAILALRSRGSRFRPGDDDPASARRHREIARRYREERASLGD